MRITSHDIKVKLQLTDKSPMIARATVIFGEIIETHGWRIFKSIKNVMHPKLQEYIWIQPPSYPAGKKWKPIVWTDDKDLYSYIEECLYDALCQKRRELHISAEYNEVLKKNDGAI
jgi:hypothetical protein